MREFGAVLLFAILAYGYGSPTQPVYDTIVVGLGASGTSAATTLAKAGRKVLALEALDRIGGRVHTIPFGDSTVELGAEWILGNESSSTYELAIKNHVKIRAQDYIKDVYFSNGISNQKDIVLALVHFTETLFLEDKRHKDPEPLGEYLTARINEFIKSNYPSIQNDTDFINGCLDMLDFYTTTFNPANNWNDISSWSNFKPLNGPQDLSWNTYGYNTLFEILLNKYNSGPGYPSLDIKLNSAVTKIQWPQTPEENVVVTVQDGTTYTAKNVIVTVSIAVLQEKYKTLFSPPLPEQKVTSIKAISLGICDKVVFRFDQIWWPKNTFNFFVWRSADKAEVKEGDQWLLRVNKIVQSMSSNNSIMIWECGDTAKKMENLHEDVVKAKVMWLLRKFMGEGKTIPEPVEMKRSLWYSNPFIRGSFSYDNVDMPSHPTARDDLAQPLVDSSGKPRVLFAGEATTKIHYGTVHGAVDSGTREANRLLSI